MKIPDKLRNGDNPFTDVPSKVNEIIDTIQAMRLVPDKGSIMLNESAFGTTIRAITRSGIASAQPETKKDEYLGYFKIKNVSKANEKKIAVVNGGYIKDTICGAWSFGSTGDTCDYIEFTITDTTNIYLKITFDPVAKTATGEILSGADVPNNSPTTDILHIGSVFSDMTIQQIYKGGGGYTVLNRWTV